MSSKSFLNSLPQQDKSKINPFPPRSRDVGKECARSQPFTKEIPPATKNQTGIVSIRAGRGDVSTILSTCVIIARGWAASSSSSSYREPRRRESGGSRALLAVIESARGNRNPADPCTSISVNLTPSGGQLTGSVWPANERTQTNVYCMRTKGGRGGSSVVFKYREEGGGVKGQGALS